MNQEPMPLPAGIFVRLRKRGAIWETGHSSFFFILVFAKPGYVFKTAVICSQMTCGVSQSLACKLSLRKTDAAAL